VHAAEVAVQITVLNRGTLSDPLPGTVARVNVMRPTVLGNPYFLRRGASLEERADCVPRYRDWLRKQYAAKGPVRAELEHLLELAQAGPVELVCCCAPLQCHADVIREALLGMAETRGIAA
jgi:hypothetical protein